METKVGAAAVAALGTAIRAQLLGALPLGANTALTLGQPYPRLLIHAADAQPRLCQILIKLLLPGSTISQHKNRLQLVILQLPASCVS